MQIAEIVARAASGNSKVFQQRESLLRIQLANHGALAALTNGTASDHDVEQLIAARNMTEAIRSVARLGMHHTDILGAAHRALLDIGKRTLDTGKPSATPDEVSALTDMLDLHDAQLERITVIQMERAINLVKNRVRSGQVSRIR